MQSFGQAELNASLNALSGVLLLIGHRKIMAGNMRAHKKYMIAAFISSSVFLVSYVIYHIRVGNVLFQGQGWIRPVYFAILISHVILAIVILPMAIASLMRGLQQKFDKHRKIARWTYPLWLYVSVTGVVVYVMLYQIYTPKM